MKAAPIQLRQISFRRVSVQVDETHLGGTELDQAEQNLSFDGVVITTHVHFSPIDQEAKTGKSFLLTLRVVIDNKTTDDDDAKKPSPYLVDIEAGGIIHVAKGAEQLGDIEDIIVVNGTSMLWGAIREQVCNLTARMPLGLAILPTVHFQDLRKQRSESEATQAKQGRTRVTKARAKPAS